MKRLLCLAVVIALISSGACSNASNEAQQGLAADFGPPGVTFAGKNCPPLSNSIRKTKIRWQ